MKYSAVIALFLANSVEAKHHHHHMTQQLVAQQIDTHDMETLESMSTNKLIEGLQSTLK